MIALRKGAYYENPSLTHSVFDAILSAGRMTVSTSGNYTLHSGRTLRGDLVMTSGETTLEEGSRVTGNVIMTSGTEISVP